MKSNGEEIAEGVWSMLPDSCKEIMIGLEKTFKESIEADVNGLLRFSERELDIAYLSGVFNVSGIEGLNKEIKRLKSIGKSPHDIIIEACRKE